MKTIKVIDLLEMIKNNEELPARVKYWNWIYEYDYDEKFYRGVENQRDLLIVMFEDYSTIDALNQKLEIIEDNPKIEKINMTDTIGDYVLADKLNEVIDLLNEMEDKE